MHTALEEYWKETGNITDGSFSLEFKLWCSVKYLQGLEKKEKEEQETKDFVKKCKSKIADKTAWPLFRRVPVDKREWFLDAILDKRNSVVYLFLKTIM